MQEQNRSKTINTQDNTHDINNGFETAKSFNKNELKLNLDFLHKKKTEEINSSQTEESDEDDDFEDENPFLQNRDIQTVKVNESRKPLTESLIESKILPLNTLVQENSEDILQNEEIALVTSNANPNDIIGNSNFDTNTLYQRKVSSSTNEPNNLHSQSNKLLSEKEKRIAEQVKQMKQKQIEHEKHKQFVNQIKPFLIGGGLLLGGFLVFEICKKNFFH
jgi:hypothetical protein